MSTDPHERAGVFDFELTFTEAEKKLFKKIHQFPPSDNNVTLQEIDDRIELIVKADQILLQYAICTLRKIFLTIYSEPDNEIDYWYFNQHFFNFLADLNDCLEKVHTWQDTDKEMFLKALEENGLKNKFYRLPRGDQVYQRLPKKSRVTKKSTLTKKEPLGR